MGVSFSCWAIVGMRLDGAKLWTTRRVPVCEHRLPDGAKFCPECGKAVTTTQQEPVPGYDPEAGTLGGLVLMPGNDGDTVFVVMAEARCGGPGYVPAKIDVPSGALWMGGIADMTERASAALGPLGLWDRRQWGIWAVMRVY